jgi:hypothetical protein
MPLSGGTAPRLLFQGCVEFADGDTDHDETRSIEVRAMHSWIAMHATRIVG